MLNQLVKRVKRAITGAEPSRKKKPKANVEKKNLAAAETPEKTLQHWLSESLQQPDSAGIRIQLGKAYYTRGMWEEAIAAFAEAARLDPTDGRAPSWLGSVYAKTGRRRKAHLAFQQALALDPDNPRYVRQLAHLFRNIHRDSIGDMMEFVRDLGFVPSTIIDVGVNTGTPGLYEIFPESHFIMVDPLAENEIFMVDLCNKFRNARYFLAAAGPSSSEAVIRVAPAFGGSGMLDVTDPRFPGQDRIVPVRRLDDLIDECQATGPYVLKIDTEGAELEVLKGADKTLESTEMIIMEARVRNIGNAPVIYEILSFLEARGFVFYDMLDRNYNDNDFTLKQFDLVAVKREGFFRTSAGYRHVATRDSNLKEKIISGKLSKRDAILQQLIASNPELEKYKIR